MIKHNHTIVTIHFYSICDILIKILYVLEYTKMEQKISTKKHWKIADFNLTVNPKWLLWVFWWKKKNHEATFIDFDTNIYRKDRHTWNHS